MRVLSFTLMELGRVRFNGKTMRKENTMIAKKIRGFSRIACIAFFAAMAGFVALALAEVTTNEFVPMDSIVEIPCAGDVVQLTGPLHVLMVTTIDATGGMHVKMHFQPQAVSGVSLITGDRYQATGVTQWQYYIPADQIGREFTLVNNFRIIGQGRGNNFLVHENVHATTNPDGTVTVDFDHLNIDCK